MGQYQTKKLGIGLALSFFLSACAVGPDYQRPTIGSPAQFKEDQGWIQAAPLAKPFQSDWWTVFGDAELNKLESGVLAANQSLQASYYTYQQALALTDSARAAEFPTVGSYVASSRTGNGGVTYSGNGAVMAGQTVGLSASWVPDFWGKVRRQVESNEASAEASRETLIAAQLSLQSALAQDYFQIRQVDSQIGLANKTVDANNKSLTLTQNRYVSGVSTQADVAQAQLQLANARVQLATLVSQRAQLEHAIAVLVGVAASSFSLPPVSTAMPKPQPVPVGLPSQLLLHRPDLIAAERQVAAANAQIGVAESAYFPALTLAASGSYQKNTFPDIFSAANLFWSAGPSLALTLFDGGARRALKAQAVSSYKQVVAQYRQTSLQAIQQVEDQLVALSALATEEALQQQAVAAADVSLRLVTNQYKSGVVSYLNVITAQTASYSARNAAIQIAGQRLTANVALIQALGGAMDVPINKETVR